MSLHSARSEQHRSHAPSAQLGEPSYGVQPLQPTISRYPQQQSPPPPLPTKCVRRQWEEQECKLERRVAWEMPGGYGKISNFAAQVLSSVSQQRQRGFISIGFLQSASGEKRKASRQGCQGSTAFLCSAFFFPSSHNNNNSNNGVTEPSRPTQTVRRTRTATLQPPPPPISQLPYPSALPLPLSSLPHSPGDISPSPFTERYASHAHLILKSMERDEIVAVLPTKQLRSRVPARPP